MTENQDFSVCFRSEGRMSRRSFQAQQDRRRAQKRVLGGSTYSFLLALGLAAAMPVGVRAGCFEDNSTTLSSTVYWNGEEEIEGRVNGGDGEWNLSKSNWTDECGSTQRTWDGSIFRGIFNTVKGNVLITEPVPFHILEFSDVQGYVIGGESLQMRRADRYATIVVDSGLFAQINANIENDPIQPRFGPDLMVMGGGQLTLVGKKTFTGETIVYEDTALSLGTSLHSGSVAGDIQLMAGAKLEVSSLREATFDNKVSSEDSSAEIRFKGGGTVYFNGDASGFSGTTTSTSSINVTSTLGGGLRMESSIQASQTFSPTLSGNGTIGSYGAKVSIEDGTISPGNITTGVAPFFGTLNIKGDLVLTEKSTLTLSLSTPDTTQNDMISVTGSVRQLPGTIRVPGMPSRGIYKVMVFQNEDFVPLGATKFIPDEGDPNEYTLLPGKEELYIWAH